MCGINGLIGFGPERGVIQRMNDALSHRGPDASGVWIDERLCLGHRRLSIIDLAKESDQPFVKDGLVCVYNGEVYNFQEIRAELENAGVAFRTSSDTEVVLEAFRKWGAASFPKFIGMFAFALYDIAKKQLFLVRDYFGIKPLYYATSIP